MTSDPNQVQHPRMVVSEAKVLSAHYFHAWAQTTRHQYKCILWDIDAKKVEAIEGADVRCT